jgi:ubiquinone/menaquinone biosynthesis C-methylase UbiE
MNEYASPNHALAYLTRAGQIPHRTDHGPRNKVKWEGEAVVLELLPRDARHILDLGTGDGRLLAVVKQAGPQAHGLALDFSPTMLAAARERFAGDLAVSVIEHNLDQTLPEVGPFDAVVSCFAILAVNHFTWPR